MSETTFENARVGDRVYSPLYACKNVGDKTNAVVKEIYTKDTFPIRVIPDVKSGNSVTYTETFTLDGKFLEGGGQSLFWENPIQAIPTRPKRKVMKEGWIGITPVSFIFTSPIDNPIAYATHVYETSDEWLSGVDKSYKIQKIQFEVEE